MSSVSGRYVRCPNCNLLNLSGSGECSECGESINEEFNAEIRRVASDVWREVGGTTAATVMGLLAGGLLSLAGGLASRGLWLSSLAELLTPPTKPGVAYMGPFILATVPIVWLILGRLEVHQLGGKVEVFDSEEVQAGAWAAGLLTVILISVSFLFFARPGSESGAALRPALLWQALPLVGQGVAIVSAVVAFRWLQARELNALVEVEE